MPDPRTLPNMPRWFKPEINQGHAICAPSSRRRWAQCPASMWEQSFARKSEPGPQARFGTEVHSMLAQALGLLSNGVSFSEYMDFIDFNTKRHQNVLRYSVNKIFFDNDIIKEPMESYIHDGRIKAEEYLYYPGLRQLSGTADVIIQPENSEMVYIIDLKTAFEVDINYARAQLEAYVLMADQSPRYNGKCYVCFLVCPCDFTIENGLYVTGVYSDFPNKYSLQIDCTISELRCRILREVSRVSADKYTRDFYFVSDETCKWCDAKWICNKNRARLSRNIMDYDPEVKNVSEMFKEVSNG